MMQIEQTSTKNIENILHEMTNVLNIISNKSNFFNSKFESSIKIKNLNILPPIIDDKLRIEIEYYKRKAKETEEILKKKRHESLFQNKYYSSTYTKLNDDKQNTDDEQLTSQTNNDLDSSANDATNFDTGSTDLNKYMCGDVDFNFMDTNMNTSIYEEDESIILGHQHEDDQTTPSSTPPRIPLERKSSFIVEKPSPLLKNFQFIDEFERVNDNFKSQSEIDFKSLCAKEELKPSNPINYLKYLDSAKGQKTNSTNRQLQFLKRMEPAANKIVDNRKDYKAIINRKLGALVKGFLVRRLLKTERVQNLVKVIRDTTQFAINFQNESPIKNGRVTNTDIDLLDRIIAQLQTALHDMNYIYFTISTKERMTIIDQDRVRLKQLAKNKLLNEQLAESKSSMSNSALSRLSKHSYLKSSNRVSAIPVMSPNTNKSTNSESSTITTDSSSNNDSSATNKITHKSVLHSNRQVKKLNSSLGTVNTGIRSQSCKTHIRLNSENKLNNSNLKRQGTITIQRPTSHMFANNIPNITTTNAQTQPVSQQQQQKIVKSGLQRKVISKDTPQITSNIPSFTNASNKQPFQMEILNRQTSREIVKPKQIDMSPKTRILKK